jgi:hypothetical protein
LFLFLSNLFLEAEILNKIFVGILVETMTGIGWKPKLERAVSFRIQYDKLVTASARAF